MNITGQVQNKETDLLARLSLLIGQSFFLGLTLGFLFVSAAALVLSIYGSKVLPIVYIVVAAAGSAFYFGFARLRRRKSLFTASIISELVLLIFILSAWVGLVYGQLEWLSIAAMVSFSISLQVGYVILRGQVERLLDIRQTKHFFPHILAGFITGLMIAGALVKPLQNWLGETENLLLVSAVCAAIMLGIFLVTSSRFKRSEDHTPVYEDAADFPPLRKVLLKRFVLLVFLYQILSAAASQLLNYLALAAAGDRFSSSSALADFLGPYTFVLNFTDLLFLALAAGILITLLGMRFTLSVNPGVNVAILIAMVTVGLVFGVDGSQFFWLAIVARLIDIVFTDGTTRTAVNATYQALPVLERAALQSGVEGIGIPLVWAFSGVTLFLFNQMGNNSLVFIAGFTLLVSALWFVIALLVNRHYGSNLLVSMRRRALEPVELTLEDKTSRDVVEKLLASENPLEVQLALDMLQGADDPQINNKLISLLNSSEDAVQIEALTRIEGMALQEATPAVEQVLNNTTKPAVQGYALRAFAALRGSDAVERIAPYLDSEDQECRLGAAVGLLRYGGISGVLAMGKRLEEWESAADPDQRCFLARVIGDVASEDVYQPLLTLLDDPDVSVRCTALAASGQVKNTHLLPKVVANLKDRRTRSSASNALVNYGDLLLPLVEEALNSGMGADESQIRLLRVFGQISSEKVVQSLRAYINHPVADLRDQVLAILASRKFQAAEEEFSLLQQSLLRDVQFGQQLLIAAKDIGSDVTHDSLHRALKEEGDQVKKRIFWNLSFLYNPEAINRAQEHLARKEARERVIGLELLNVTISSDHRGLVGPLVDPEMEDSRRLVLLGKNFQFPSLRRDERLQELSRNYAQPWIRACALYAAALTRSEWMLSTVENALIDHDPVVRETAAWGLFQLAPDRFAKFKDGLLTDKDRQVVLMAASLIEEESI